MEEFIERAKNSGELLKIHQKARYQERLFLDDNL